MNAALEKAGALIEAHRYILSFRDKIVVVKVGGSVQEDQEKLRGLLSDISFMAAVGMRPVIVHGGGKAITAAMNAAGLQARFVQGRRYTDRATLEIAERILAQEINKDLVEHLIDTGATALGLHSMGSCVLFGERLYLTEPASAGSNGATGPAAAPNKIDIGYVGTVTEVNTVLLKALCEDGFIPVIAPIAIAREGSPEGVWKLNVNADTAAGVVAAALQAEKLVMMSDTNGIRTDSSRADSYASTLTRAEIEALVEREIIGEGMLPKVDACITALEAGVPKAHIIDGRIPHSILLEIYTDAGVGTQIILE